MTKNFAAFATFAFAFAYPDVTAPFRGADAYCFFGLFFFLLLVPCFLWNWTAAGLFSQMVRGLVIDRHQQLALGGARYVSKGPSSLQSPAPLTILSSSAGRVAESGLRHST